MEKFFSFFIFFFFISKSLAQVDNEDIFARARLNSVLGQDGVTPIEVKFKNGEKKLLWTFGDTILGNWKGEINTKATLNFSEIADIKSMPSNSLAMTELIGENNYKDIVFNFYPENKKISEFIKYSIGENPFIKRMWADDGIQIKDKVYVYYMDVEVNKEKDGDFNFKGTGMAVSEVPDKPRISDFKFERVTGFYSPDILLGDCIIKKGNYIYILGRKSEKNDKILNSLIFARVKPAKLDSYSNYEFLSSHYKWQKKGIKTFFNDVVGESSLIFDENQKLFRIIYMSISGEIKKVSFKNFKDLGNCGIETVYTPPKKENVMYYSAKEIFYTDKYLYVIYINPSIYQPILIKVPVTK